MTSAPAIRHSPICRPSRSTRSRSTAPSSPTSATTSIQPRSCARFSGIGARYKIGAVHQPHRRRAITVLPFDIGLAVAIEVAGAVHLPRPTRIEADIGAADQARAVHQPHCGLSVVVLPQNIGLAVAIE